MLIEQGLMRTKACSHQHLSGLIGLLLLFIFTSKNIAAQQLPMGNQGSQLSFVRPLPPQAPAESVFRFDAGNFSIALLRSHPTSDVKSFELIIGPVDSYPLRYQSFPTPSRLLVAIDGLRILRPRRFELPEDRDVRQVEMFMQGEKAQIEISFRNQALMFDVQGARKGHNAVIRLDQSNGSSALAHAQRNKLLRDLPSQRPPASTPSPSIHSETEQLAKQETAHTTFFQPPSDTVHEDLPPAPELMPLQAEAPSSMPDLDRKTAPAPIIATEKEEYFLRRLESVDVAIENQYDQNLSVEARVGRLVLPGTEHEHIEVDAEVQIEPKQLMLKKGQRATFHLLYLGSSVLHEKTFQLELNAQLKKKQKAKKRSLGTLRVPLFTIPATPQPDVEWEREAGVLGIINTGNVSVVLREGRMCSALTRECQPIGPIRAFPGNKVGVQLPADFSADFQVYYQQGKVPLFVPPYRKNS
jgi:hypothetical protein